MIKRTLSLKICRRCHIENKLKFSKRLWYQNRMRCIHLDGKPHKPMETCWGYYDPKNKNCGLDILHKECEVIAMRNVIGKNIMIPHWCPYEVEHIMTKN